MKGEAASLWRVSNAANRERACGFGGAFSLTLALFRWERE